MSVQILGHKVYKITDIINGHLVTRIYIYYTKREAIKEFRAEFKGQS
jgi:hypothetical protein